MTGMVYGWLTKWGQVCVSERRLTLSWSLFMHEVLMYDWMVYEWLTKWLLYEWMMCWWMMHDGTVYEWPTVWVNDVFVNDAWPVWCMSDRLYEWMMCWWMMHDRYGVWLTKGVVYEWRMCLWMMHDGIVYEWLTNMSEWCVGEWFMHMPPVFTLISNYADSFFVSWNFVNLYWYSFCTPLASKLISNIDCILGGWVWSSCVNLWRTAPWSYTNFPSYRLITLSPLSVRILVVALYPFPPTSDLYT